MLPRRSKPGACSWPPEDHERAVLYRLAKLGKAAPETKPMFPVPSIAPGPAKPLEEEVTP